MQKLFKKWSHFLLLLFSELSSSSEKCLVIVVLSAGYLVRFTAWDGADSHNNYVNWKGWACLAVISGFLAWLGLWIEWKMCLHNNNIFNMIHRKKNHHPPKKNNKKQSTHFFLQFIRKHETEYGTCTGTDLISMTNIFFYVCWCCSVHIFWLMGKH